MVFTVIAPLRCVQTNHVAHDSLEFPASAIEKIARNSNHGFHANMLTTTFAIVIFMRNLQNYVILFTIILECLPSNRRAPPLPLPIGVWMDAG